MTAKQAAGFRVNNNNKKKTDLVIGVWVRPVTRAVEPTEVVIVAISNIFLFFNLKRKRGNEQLKQLERIAHVANTSGRQEIQSVSQDLAGNGSPQTFCFHNHSENFCKKNRNIRKLWAKSWMLSLLSQHRRISTFWYTVQRCRVHHGIYWRRPDKPQQALHHLECKCCRQTPPVSSHNPAEQQHTWHQHTASIHKRLLIWHPEQRENVL